MKLRDLNDNTVSGYIRESAMPTLVVFFAKWSKPARTMLPVLEELTESYSGMIRFGLIDVDHGQNSLDDFGILTLPTFVLFKRGHESDRFIGLLTKEKLTERLERCLQKSE